MAKLSIIHGDKGGVGKSFFASVYIDYLLSKTDNKNVYIIESDTRTPDVYNRFKDYPNVLKLDLKDKAGWFDFVNLIEEQPETEFVVNLPAGIGEFFAENDEYLADVLQQLNCELCVFWPLSRMVDSIASLYQFHTTEVAKLAKETSGIYVIKNGFFGAENKFTRWNDSTLRKENCFGEIFLLELHDRVTDKTTKLPFSKALNGLKIGEKAELQRWLKHTFKTLDTVGKEA